MEVGGQLHSLAALTPEKYFMTWPRHIQVLRVASSCLLLSDGHTSHTNLQTLKFYKENNIHMFCLSSHATYRLQPLGRSIFRPLRSYYDNECNSFIWKTKREM